VTSSNCPGTAKNRGAEWIIVLTTEYLEMDFLVYKVSNDAFKSMGFSCIMGTDDVQSKYVAVALASHYLYSRTYCINVFRPTHILKEPLRLINNLKLFEFRFVLAVLTDFHQCLVIQNTRNCDKLPKSSQRAPRELPESSHLQALVKYVS
jgi:hypothetical protein